MCAASVSCQAFFGVDEYTGAGGSKGSGARGGSGDGGSSSGHGGSGGGAVGSGGGGPCVCANTVPAPWSGPYYLAPGDTSCPGDEKLAYEGTPDAHQCGACGCGPPQAGCSDASVTCWSQSGCGGTEVGTYYPDNCFPGSQPGVTCKVDTATFPGGPCAPMGGDITSKPGWKTTHHLCVAVPDGGTCEGGQCVAVPTEAKQVCIWGTEPSCPDGWSGTTLYAFGSQQDTRACSPCTCVNAPPGNCIGVEYETCEFFPKSIGANACFASDYAINLVSVPQPASSCAAGTSMPTGEFKATEPLTICCNNL